MPDLDMRLEVVVLPVTDFDRAKEFYVEKVGFALDVDTTPAPGFRVVQMSPPGSACSITVGTGLGHGMEPGSLQGLHLVVADIDAARAELVERGVEASEPFHFGAAGQTQGLHPERVDYGTFMSFSDPDGNGWLVQEVKYANPRT
jgi:catechol 2,3-dioxygenase-like lactoylglutathione lyase family enzyme